MRRLLRFLHVILTCIISFLIFYYGTSEFLNSHFQGLFTIQAPLYLLILFGQTLIFYGGSYLLLNPSHRIPTFVLRLLWIIYFLVMILLLFFRVYQDNNINLNIFELFNFETTNLSQTILNLLLFIPIGYWFKHLKISFRHSRAIVRITLKYVAKNRQMTITASSLLTTRSISAM